MKRLLKVQQEIGTLSKNAKNPFFKSQYLDLTTIIQHVTPLLNAEGLVLIQPLAGDSVTTAILDSETGEVIASSSLTLAPMTDPQKMGSQITYFRRYTLKSLLAIAEEDDDGNRASRTTPKPKLSHDELAELHANGTLESLRSALTKYDLTPEQRETITNRGKELKDGNK